MAVMRENSFYRRLVSLKHLETLGTFMERYPTLALACARSREEKDEARKTWDKIAITLNKIDPKLVRNGRNWCRYWYDLKCKIRRKYSCIRKCQLEGIQCSLRLGLFEKRMVKVLTDKEGNLYPRFSVHVAEFHSPCKQKQIKTEQPATIGDLHLSTSISNDDDDNDDDDINDLKCEDVEKRNKDNHIKLDTNIYENDIVIEELNLQEDDLLVPREISADTISFLENDTISNTSNPEQENDPIKIEAKNIEDLKKDLLEFELTKRKELFEIEKKQSREKHELEIAILRLKRDILMKEVNKL